MSDTSATMTAERLKHVLEAWSTGGVEDIMSFFADEPTFHPSSGPEPLGATHRGGAAVRAAVTAFVTNNPVRKYVAREIVIAGDQGFVSWGFSGTNAAGESSSFEGCDIYTFDGDRIAVKSGYRKVQI